MPATHSPSEADNTPPRPLTIEHPVSAGGVAYRRAGPGWEVLLCGRQTPPTWGLPKGTPNPGESLLETAKREVEEETGLEVEVGEMLGFIRYWFTRDEMRFHKTVHFFLMRPVGGSLDRHDPEYDIVQWFPVEQACRTLTFQNEVDLVRRAVSLLETERPSR